MKGPRDTRFHRAIVSAQAIPNTRAGHWLQLECGHVVQAFGDIAQAGGRALCTKCRDSGEP